MIVIRQRPPLWDLIDATFDIKGKPVIFTFGNAIYNPTGIAVTPELLAHEEVHKAQQLNFRGNGAAVLVNAARELNAVEAWWQRYCADPRFRFEQEVPAHIEEFKEFCRNNARGQARNNRRIYFHSVAKRLCSPLYGSLCSYESARGILKSGGLASNTYRALPLATSAASAGVTP